MARHEQQSHDIHPDARRLAEAALAPFPQPLLDLPRVARLLSVDVRRLYELAEAGDICCVRVGKRGRRVFRTSLLEWLARGGCGP
jgi:excisionase family DNA binding protein